MMLSLLSPPAPFSNFPHTVIGIRGNLPAGWLIDWNICQNEENSSHETNYFKAKEAQRDGDFVL